MVEMLYLSFWRDSQLSREENHEKRLINVSVWCVSRTMEYSIVNTFLKHSA